MLCFISALRQTTVADVAIITALVPFITAYLGWAALREVSKHAAVLASTTALIGVALMAGVSTDDSAIGDMLAVLMAVCMAAMILIRRRYGSIPALASTCLALIFCAAATLPLASLTTVTAPDLALLPLMETALITALEAPLAPLWVWLAFGETPEAATLIGGGVVLTAVLANSVRANRQASLPR